MLYDLVAAGSEDVAEPAALFKLALALSQAPPAQDRWHRDLLRGPYGPELPRALQGLEAELSVVLAELRQTPLSAASLSREIRQRLLPMARTAAQAGVELVHRATPARGGVKLAGYLDWDIRSDVDAIVAAMGERAVPDVHAAVQEAFFRGSGPPAGVLAKVYDADKATSVARTVMLNIAAKAAIREADRSGYTLVRRMEVNDAITCDRCWGLNYRLYKVADLLPLPNPLTRDSHDRCRGIFSPVVNSLARLPRGELEHTVDWQAHGRRIEQVPVEHAPWLRPFLQRTPLPFDVRFESPGFVGVQVQRGVLKVHPDVMRDTDPRAAILMALADTLWPRYQAVFQREYGILVRTGLVKPNRTAQDWRELWQLEFSDWRLGQQDDFFGQWWFKLRIR